MNTRSIRIMSLASVVAALVGCFVGCSNEHELAAPESNIATATPGELHNDVLGDVFERLDARGEKYFEAPQLARVEACYDAVNEILVTESIELSMEEIEAMMDLGEQRIEAILQDPFPELETFSADVFGDSTDDLESGMLSREFFDRYIQIRYDNFLAGVDARTSYAQVCSELGTPLSGSELEVVFDVMLASEDFWSERYPDAWSPDKGWRKVFAAIACAAVDAGSGFLVGAGTERSVAPGAVLSGALSVRL